MRPMASRPRDLSPIIHMKSLRSFIVAVAAAVLSSSPAFAGDPTGVWKFAAELEGRSIESTLTLAWNNQQLSGSLQNRAGKVEITDAKFSNEHVSFTVVRTIGKRLRKKTFTVHYAGKLEGDTINGTIQATGRKGKEISTRWEAKRDES
jgi:hypothetical protein